jgi:hypothetical protein
MIDQHFTPLHAAETLTAHFVNKYDPDRNGRYVEPSVGEGAFVEALIKSGVPRGRITTLDIDPTLPSDITGDFLEWSPPAPVDFVIGNPPFGRQGKIARDFIRHGLTVARVVGFVMPRSSATAPAEFVSLIDAKFDKTNVKTIWAEYAKNDLERFTLETPAMNQKGFKFVQKDDNHDLVLQRCGSGLGRLTTCNGTGQGKYYIKLTDKRLRPAFEHLAYYLHYSPEHKLCGHQPTLSRPIVAKLVTIAFFDLTIEE